jgi:hypothetical protein
MGVVIARSPPAERSGLHDLPRLALAASWNVQRASPSPKRPVGLKTTRCAGVWASHLTDALAAAVVQTIGVGIVFRDIDADVSFFIFPTPLLLIRGGSSGICTGLAKDEGDPTISRPVKRSNPFLAAVERTVTSPAAPFSPLQR